jgi:zinc transporter ZupT
MAGAGGPLAALTELPLELLRYAGLSLFPIAAFMALVGARATHRAPLVWLVVVGNAAWVGVSAWLLFSGVVTPNLLGKAFLALQAGVVLVLTVLETEALFGGRPRHVGAA